MRTAKRIMLILSITALLCCLLSVAAFAAGSGDVAGAVESTWTAASSQIKSVVNKVVFPAIDMNLCGPDGSLLVKMHRPFTCQCSPDHWD